MNHNQSPRKNPDNSITPFEDQARLRNFITTNDQNLFGGNNFANQNHNERNNYDRYSTTPSVEDWEAELISRLPLMSSSTNSSNTDDHTRDPNLFERRIDQNSLIENDTGAPNIIHPQNSSFQSSTIDTELDNMPVGPRNEHNYRHGRQIGSTRTRADELDYNAIMLKLIESGNLSKIQIIYLTHVHLHELMVERVGNCFVQSLLRTCEDNLINHLLFSLIRKKDLFVAVCLDDRGHRALVKLMDRLIFSNQQFTIALEISEHVVTLAKNSHGGHEVLKRCFLSLSREANELVLLRIAQNCLEIVRDKAGCCILQECIKYAIREVREALIYPLIKNAQNLSTHPYGNYTIQYLIHLDGANIGSRIIKELKNNFVGLSLDKHGSNVVEKCIYEGGSNEIIFELMENDQNLAQVCADQYGNYVVQKAISVSKGNVYKLLVKAIKNHGFFLRFHPYGKNVVGAIKRISKKFKSPVF